MTWGELRQNLIDGVLTIVRFVDKVESLDCDDCPDSGMVAKLIQVEVDTEDEELLHLAFDLSDFEEQNKLVASHDWIDENGDPTLTWFETRWYPKDGVCHLYVFGNMDSLVDIIEVIESCPYCYGDKALYWEDEAHGAFIDRCGEMLVTIDGKEIRFKVDRCPKCGRVFK